MDIRSNIIINVDAGIGVGVDVVVDAGVVVSINLRHFLADVHLQKCLIV